MDSEINTSRPLLNVPLYILGPCFIIAIAASFQKNTLGTRFRLAVVIGIAAMSVRAVKFTVGGGPQNYSVGCAFGPLFFNAVALLLLSDPVRECKYVSQTEDTAKMPFWKRVYWVLCIQCNLRGIRWNFEIEQLTPKPRHTRLRFLFTRILRLMWYAVIADIAEAYVDTNPIFSLSGTKARSLRSQGPIMSFFNVVGFFAMTYSTINMVYDVLAFVSVAVGYCEPDQWPVTFGRWKDSYTIRRFWGRTWHQMMRRFVVIIGKSTARFLGFTPGTWLSAHTQLLVGFTVSGLAHVPGDRMVDPYWTGSSYWFFLYNALAITLEDFVISVGKRVGVRDSWTVRMLGYAWTVAWLTYAVPYYADWMIAAGLGYHRVFPRSLVVKPVLGYIARVTGVDVLGWITQQCMLRL